MLTFKTGDVTKAKEKGIQLLVHCVNSGFYFGSGVAVAINNHFAGSVEQYVNWCSNHYWNHRFNHFNDDYEYRYYDADSRDRSQFISDEYFQKSDSKNLATLSSITFD
jgi:uncharacterized protein YodC (DUF2158 family)